MNNLANRNPNLIKVVPNFLDNEELAFWRGHITKDEFWVAVEGRDHIEGQPPHYTFNDSYWAGNNLNAVWKYVNSRMHKFLEYEYGDDLLYKPAPAFRKWVEGTHMGGHGDGFRHDRLLDFEPVRFGEIELVPRAYFEIATVLYYNDDFDGGELFFTKIGYEIRPEAGMLISFPCSYGYEHGVNEITGGERLTSATHWIRCGTMARALMQNSLPENWHYSYENTDLVFQMMGHKSPPKPENILPPGPIGELAPANIDGYE